ncbi:hypothetical protein [Sansalvadorimonas verongulae]|uniref:hypothetical protein n=1 Tax=Sansalvadorimonas verongulae TaxID=2172824 RepID=UPI0012BCB799|nr:hypothetical protein [Sansalvadorimonas verongulae]MTI15212.1 hypothetical protein [Sansalvadorimonas verongulae]
MGNEKKQPYAKVVKVIDSHTVVINKGWDDGIKEDSRVLVYCLEDELFDPDSGESLGFLEIVKGTGKVVNAQERMATIKSDMVRNGGSRVRRPDANPINIAARLSSQLFVGTEEIIEKDPDINVPFDYPHAGDFVKKI